MDKLDVFELAKIVNKESISGAVAIELLSQGNDLYEPAQRHNKLKRIKPNGEVSEGYFQDNQFVVEKTLICASRK